MPGHVERCVTNTPSSWKGALVEEQVDALPGGETPGFVDLLHAVDAPAEERLLAVLREDFEFILFRLHGVPSSAARDMPVATRPHGHVRVFRHSTARRAGGSIAMCPKGVVRAVGCVYHAVHRPCGAGTNDALYMKEVVK